MNKNITIFAIILSALMALDVITTKFAIGASMGQEANPFMAMLVNDTALFLLVKAVGTIAIICGLKWVYMRNKLYSRIGQGIIVTMMIFVVLNNLIVISNAESGVLVINKNTFVFNTATGSSAGSSLDLRNFSYSGTTYNYFSEYNLTGIRTDANPNSTEVWQFTITGDVNASSMNGNVVWIKSAGELHYYFPDDLKFTKSTGVINLTDFFIVGSGTSTNFNSEFVSGGFNTCSATPTALNGVTNPVTYRITAQLTSCTPAGTSPGAKWNSTVGTKNYNQYSVTYPGFPDNSFQLVVNKKYNSNTLSTIINLTNGFVNYSGFPETSQNNNNLTYTNIYNNGLYITMTDTAGLTATAWINQSGSPFAPPVVNVGTGGSTGGQLRYNYTSAVRGQTYGFVSNITDANFSAVNEYALYAYDFNNNLVTGFPIKFYSRNYSTLNMWTFAHAGSYHTNLTSCDIPCRGAQALPFAGGFIPPTVIDTATIDVSDAPGTYAITTDRTTYLPGQNIIVTVTRPAGVNVWVTALENINYTTFPDIAFNLPFTNGVNTQTIILPSNIPYGNYSFFMFLNSDGTNQVAATQFNIGITSGTLGVIWSAKEQVTGTYATVKASTALNYSTLQITNPYGVVNSFNISPNTVNITSVYLNAEGYWNANITDNGNTSNISTSTLHANALTTNETFTQCTSKYIYVCWDKQVYLQGEPYTITYKFPISAWNIGETVWLFVFNPNSVEVVDYYANSTFNILAGQWVGSIHGTFSPTATVGVYTAYLINKGAAGNTTKATAQARVNPSTATTSSTTTQATTASILTGTFFAALLILFVFLEIGGEMGGVVGSIVGFGGGMIYLGVYNMMPLWALFLFAILIITVFAIIVGSKVVGSGQD